jgi:hypothetical protein
VSFNLGQNLFFLFRRNASVGNRYAQGSVTSVSKLTVNCGGNVKN